ncbi:phosphoribosylanthranilate isomerase [Campylobacter sp. 7477a]|uniref:phosphoribosylanthranilate isomerase n=1 Tax=Campylobacter sp. 7477a TaxID=2735741 RepID=UPI003014ACCE|nr:phosphoribosylanthranilate isomerase [Campylobacter sp. 7477a]
MSSLNATRLKICGIKNVKEALDVLEFDVDYIGVIFAQSVRQVAPDTAKEISALARERDRKCVGVFAGQSDSEIVELCEFAMLNVAQIHGEISQSLYLGLKNLDVEVWRVLSVSEGDLPKTNEPNDMVLYDCKGRNLGGNGVSFEWQKLENLEPFSFGIAGGIDENNACAALKFNPLVIDANSKLEDEKFIKIPSKVAVLAAIVNNKMKIE